MNYPIVPDYRNIISHYYIVSNLNAFIKNNIRSFGNHLAHLIRLVDEIEFATQLKYEYGSNKNTLESVLNNCTKEIEGSWKLNIPLDRNDADTVKRVLFEVERVLKNTFSKIMNIPENSSLKMEEPNEYEKIMKLRSKGPRKISSRIAEQEYKEKLEGAIIARSAGCILGSIVEGWDIVEMIKWANKIGDNFPPTNYWSKAKYPKSIRYSKSTCESYTREKMDGVPVDDDIMYILLGLLLLEEYGFDFTTQDVGKSWYDYLYWVFKDMQWPLEMYIQGTEATKAAEQNPYSQCICAGIRCDAYGYISPGLPELAAKLCYKDAIMSHRRNGVYSAMFFAATIAAAFMVDKPIDAIKIGLTEIPSNSTIASALKWCLKERHKVKTYRDARKLVDNELTGMNQYHAINNACLTVFGLLIGENDVTKVLSNTVAMGLDNDCTAATAGSIVGAIVGKKGIPSYWYNNFNNKIHSYIKGHEIFYIDDIVRRFYALAIENAREMIQHKSETV